MKKIFVVILLILFTYEGVSQGKIFFTSDKNSFWVPLSFSGEFRGSSHYRNQEIYRESLFENRNTRQFSIGTLLRSKSYIWHKNFLMLDAEIEYNPIFNKENFIVIPDRAETRTLKRLNLRTTLFNNKVLTLNTTTDLSQIFSNRENRTEIETNRKQFGGILRYSNKALPISFSFNKTNWDQEEFGKNSTNQEDSVVREYDMDQLNLSIRASKSFYSIDKHDFVYSHDEYNYNNNRLFQTQNISNTVTVNDNFYFNKKKNANFTSRISYRNQTGTVNHNRFMVFENLLLKLPYKFNFQASYNYNKNNHESQHSKTHNVKGILSQKLFLSLNTNIFYEYQNIKHSVFEETHNTFGGNVYYTKKLPFKSRITLTYNYRQQNFKTINQTQDVLVIDESQVLTDAEITILNRPYIDISTILIRDITGAIIYQENLDYVIIERNSYVEIQRFPGGQIADGTGVLIDYVVRQPDSYSYTSNLNKLSGKLNLFYNILETYFSVANQDYINLEEVDMMTLNHYTQYSYGALINFKFATIGVEFDNYYSSIIPFRMKRYYINFNQSFFKRVLVSVNGNIRDYYLINERTNQLFTAFSAKVAYRIFDLTKLCVQLGYREQIGTGINLDLFTTRIELMSQLRKLLLTVGYEKYNKIFLEDRNNYDGVYFKLIRKF